MQIHAWRPHMPIVKSCFVVIPIEPCHAQILLGTILDLKFRYSFLTNVRHFTDIFRGPRRYSRFGLGALESSRDRRSPSLHRGRSAEVSILFPAGAVGAPGHFSAILPHKLEAFQPAWQRTVRPASRKIIRRNPKNCHSEGRYAPRNFSVLSLNQ
jgi:hypothetical protein